MAENEKYLRLLLSDIDARMGRSMLSPTDFEYLHNAITDELNKRVSVSTLKRLWGYSKYLSEPRVSTLSTLSRLVGYSDWEYYQRRRLSADDDGPSAMVLCDKITVRTDLESGMRLRLTWPPQRVCEVAYRGDEEFEVLASKNTSIKPGDWFCCCLIVSGEPLWLSNLRHYGQPPVAYVCGKQGGVRFEVINQGD